MADITAGRLIEAGAESGPVLARTEATPEPPAPKLAPAESLFKRQVAEFFASPVAAAAAFVLFVCVLLAVFAPVISPQNPYDLAALDIMDNVLPPGSELGSGVTAWLGTDKLGRDMLSGIFYGLRISLFVGLASTLIALLIGAAVGVLAAYFGGKVDAAVMRLVDLQLSFPAILIALCLLVAYGRGIDKVILALVLVKWAYYARTVRGSALVETRRDYIEAARSLALPVRRVVFRHLLPNCLPPLIVVATVQIAQAIALEATLSFLGVGVPVTEPSLGMLIANGYEFLLSGKYWISVFPGIALVVVIVAINLVGDRLRDVLNPRLAK
jgi:peptide/nickel transport system permease protein